MRDVGQGQGVPAVQLLAEAGDPPGVLPAARAEAPALPVHRVPLAVEVGLQLALARRAGASQSQQELWGSESRGGSGWRGGSSLPAHPPPGLHLGPARSQAPFCRSCDSSLGHCGDFPGLSLGPLLTRAAPEAAWSQAGRMGRRPRSPGTLGTVGEGPLPPAVQPSPPSWEVCLRRPAIGLLPVSSPLTFQTDFVEVQLAHGKHARFRGARSEEPDRRQASVRRTTMLPTWRLPTIRASAPKPASGHRRSASCHYR